MSMRILGIDPGTIVLGYGLIDDLRDEMSLVHFDTIKCKARSDMSERLAFSLRWAYGCRAQV